MTRLLGIDPGLTGALALVSSGGELLEVADMPVVAGEVNGWALTALLADWGAVERVAIERVASRPGQGVASVFKFGCGYGVVQGVLAALERPVVFVTPGVWTRHHRVGSDKDEHRRRCCELWPAHAALWARKKDDGRADAALIAAWAAETVRAVASHDHAVEKG